MPGIGGPGSGALVSLDDRRLGMPAIIQVICVLWATATVSWGRWPDWGMETDGICSGIHRSLIVHPVVYVKGWWHRRIEQPMRSV